MAVTFIDGRDVRPDPEKEFVLIGQYSGLSTDTKPTANVGSGSTFYEDDTGDIWSYDANNTNPITSDGWWRW